MPPGSTCPDEGGGVFALTFVVIDFFVFEDDFLASFDLDFFAGEVFNDAAARFSFPASAFRAEVGTAAPFAERARADLRFRRIDSRLAFRRSP